MLCLVPTAATGGSPWLALVGLAAGWRLTTGLEVTEARRRGATVTVVGPDAAAASAMGSNPMDPRPADLVLAEGFRQGAAAFAGDVYDPATRARR